MTATNYTISYSSTNTICFSDSNSGISTNETTHQLTNLEEGTEYFITVVAVLLEGISTENITATTLNAGLY